MFRGKFNVHLWEIGDLKVIWLPQSDTLAHEAGIQNCEKLQKVFDKNLKPPRSCLLILP